mmetsp:Transcript_23134/g.65551  ORF Transcript_23134/g.65551 Transcript_23134/m.65551 type:complete len:223 (+) Transcript_23134:509-1177(+)
MSIHLVMPALALHPTHQRRIAGSVSGIDVAVTERVAKLGEFMEPHFPLILLGAPRETNFVQPLLSVGSHGALVSLLKLLHLISLPLHPPCKWKILHVLDRDVAMPVDGSEGKKFLKFLLPNAALVLVETIAASAFSSSWGQWQWPGLRLLLVHSSPFLIIALLPMHPRIVLLAHSFSAVLFLHHIPLREIDPARVLHQLILPFVFQRDRSSDIEWDRLGHGR